MLWDNDRDILRRKLKIVLYIRLYNTIMSYKFECSILSRYQITLLAIYNVSRQLRPTALLKIPAIIIICFPHIYTGTVLNCSNQFLGFVSLYRIFLLDQKAFFVEYSQI